MREFMTFCLSVLQALVSMLFNFSLGDYSYGAFLVVCLLVGTLVGALVIQFNPKVRTPSPPSGSHGRKPGGSGGGAG